jgi:ankyrin repeat protein
MDKPLPKDLKREDVDRFNDIVKKLGILPKYITNDQFVDYVESGNSPMVKLALENNLIQLNPNYSYLLFDAAQKGYTEIVELLLKDPNIDPNYKNCKALIYAAYYDYDDIVKILLSRPEIVFDPNKVLKYADGNSKKLIENYLKNKQK